MKTPASANPAPNKPASTRPKLTSRQEAFCEAMSANVGGAEAARRAGYSVSGAKQRGAFLMRQPEIRLRVDEIRAARRAQHQAHLNEADEQVGWVIEDAFESKRPALALRAIEFRLKLRGVIQDKRIAQHYHGAHDTRPHPDADLESLPGDPDEDLDPIRFSPGFDQHAQATPAPRDDQSVPIVTNADLPTDFPPPPKPVPAKSALAPVPNRVPPANPLAGMTYDDLFREIERITSDFPSLLTASPPAPPLGATAPA
ncbi:hypothetical protein N825_05505 [Skermanella stibiiresistens SB22]|uniref:Terminase n=1 Tax=Skermanella stibiiresistens SB22 TaxID=1385369 RepID=W9H4Q6_9PROT|nr:terminase small subunit [Skermanella stibiiresistens]EWY39672.1 hypothetical protein N825_05505 [Skermanella stibiiresistens SB22]